MKRTLILACTLTWPAYAAPSAWLQERTANFHRFDGRFDSGDYGFSVAPAPAAAQYVTNGGDANHGPIMILGERRDIVVYPDYVDPGAKPCRDTQFPWERTSSRAAGTARLGNRLGCVVTFTRGSTVWRVVQTLGRGKGAGIMLTLLLTTTRRWAHADFASFQRVADSYRTVPIYP